MQSPFQPVPAHPDFPAQEHATLETWRERRTFARLRARNADGPRWSFLDGPITANNPMGVHHAWGRTYKDLFQRFHAMLGQDQRWQNGFDCQGLWVEVNVERDLGFTSKRDIEDYGIARVREPVQAARAHVRRRPDRAVDPPRDVDGLERPARAAPPARPAGGRSGTGDHGGGPARPGHRHGRADRRAARDARSRRLLLHLLQREQRPDLGLPREVPPSRLAVQGPRHHAVVRAVRDRHQPARDVRRATRNARTPGSPSGSRCVDRPGESLLVWTTTPWTLTCNVAAAVGPNLRYVRSGRTTTCTGWAKRHPPARARRAVRGARGTGRRRPGRLELRGPVRRPARGAAGVCGRAGPRRSDRTSTASSHGTRSARKRAPGSSTSPPAAAPRTSSSAVRSACRLIAPLDENGVIRPGLRVPDRVGTSGR